MGKGRGGAYRARMHLLPLLVAILIVACAADPVLAPRDCTPGQTIPCACPGASAVQVCDPDGHLGACACPDGGGADDVVPVQDRPAPDAVAPEDRPSADVVAARDVASSPDVVDAGVGRDVLDESAICRIRCGPNAECTEAGCRCTGDAVSCGGICRDLRTDPMNCGACGSRCPVGHSCSLGVCAGVLADGGVVCGLILTTLASDTRNCGACGNVCPAGRRCIESQCVTAGGCGSTRDDSANCGSCNYRCPAGQICDLSRCVRPACLYCDGQTCAPLATDSAHCGGCGRSCGAGRQCIAGTCR